MSRVDPGTMPPRLRAGRTRRWIRHLVRLGAVLVIALAAIVATLRLALPWLVSDPQRVARLLSERLQAPVSLAGSTAEVLGATPYLRLQGLQVGSGDQKLVLAEAELELDLSALFLRWRPVIADLRLRGLDIELLRTPDGLQVRGLPLPSGGSFDALAWAERVGQLSLRDSRFRWSDAGNQTTWTVDALDVRMQQRNGQLQMGARTSEGLALVAHFDPDAAQPLQAWLHGSQIAIPDHHLRVWDATLLGGQMDIDLRAALDAGGDWQVQGHLQVQDSVVQGRTFALPEDEGLLQPRVRLPLLRMAGQVAGRADGGVLGAFEVQTDLQTGQVHLEQRPGAGLRWSAQDLDLRMLANLGQSSARVPAPLASMLYRLQPVGVIRQASGWLGPHPWARIALTGVGIEGPSPQLPDLAGLDLDVMLDAQAAVYTLTAPQAQFHWPLALRTTLPFDAAAQGVVAWSHSTFEVEADQLRVAHADAVGVGHARLRVAQDQPPELELALEVQGGSVGTAKHFWLLHRMPPRAVEWLDRALVAGRVTEGALTLRGPLGAPHWPYREHQGRLDAHARLVDGVVDYHPEWPQASGLQADVQFINDGLVLRQATASMAGVPIEGQGQVTTFKDPVLQLQVSGTASAEQWLPFLRATPVGARHGSHLVGMRAKGEISAQAQVQLPLKRGLGAPVLDGTAQLAGVDFSDSKWLLDFRDVRGQARFTRAGFAAEGLAVRTALDHAGTLDVAVGLTSRPESRVEARLQGRFAPADLFGAHEAMTPLLAYLEGTSTWDLELDVPQADAPSRLLARSRLVGTSLALPAPLGKAAPEARDLSIAMAFPPEAGQPLQVRLGTEALAEIRLPTPRQAFAGVLHLGPGAQIASLPEQGLWIEGQLPDDDPFRWLTVAATFGGHGGDGTLAFAGADVQLERAGEPPGHIRIWPDTEASAGWSVALDTRAVVGQLRWQVLPGARSSVTADFKRLHLPEPEPAAGWPRAALSPERIPTLHVRAQDLRLGGMHLGELRLETYPVTGGMRIDRLETQAPHLELRGNGSWTVTEGVARSELDLRFSADDLGKMLRSLGFSDPVQGGQTLATLHAGWDGSPADFGLERVRGSLEIWVGAGRFVDVSPGAGRLFGLLSLTALPRRLALDFRDFFQSGMAFDEIRGRFQLDEGNAWTDDLRIRAPSADVLIIGRTGVAARDYDQQMTVLPKLGGVLPLVGALAGGPGGAAAGLLAQGVLRGERSVMQREYRIDGSWDHPRIERESVPKDG